jgi:UDP-GlcNAc:undecaprenyl-phosphate/decaprenyl-phosphate GlcNAc-1-phosphate transferase
MGEVWLTLAAGGAAFLVAGAGTWGMLRATQRWRLLDRPNERSAHRVPMPTGGGLGLIAGVWAGALLLLALGHGSALLLQDWLWAWAGGSLVLLLMAVDDLVRPLNVGEKMGLLCLAIGVWLWWGPRLEWVTLPWEERLALGPWSWGLTLFWFLALCNAYNFMDGIDGITGVQTVGVGLSLLFCLRGLGAAWGEAILLIGAAGGFLIFNRPPARIFIGDVGSTFLGFVLAGLGVLGERLGLPLWLFAAFMGYYLFDTGYTLVRRALCGENLFRAHRKHLYQRLDRLGWSHRRIDLWVLAIDLLLGIGGYVYLLASRRWGALLIGVGAVALLGQTLWIERKDRSFA